MKVGKVTAGATSPHYKMAAKGAPSKGNLGMFGKVAKTGGAENYITVCKGGKK